jgi:hypothetical protein
MMTPLLNKFLTPAGINVFRAVLKPTLLYSFNFFFTCEINSFGMFLDSSKQPSQMVLNAGCREGVEQLHI